MNTIASLFDSRAGKLLLVSTVVLVCIWAMRYVGPLFAPVFFAFTLVVLLYPVLQRFVSWGLPRPLAIVALAGLVVGFFALLFWVVIWSFSQIAHNMPTYIAGFEYQIQPLIDWLQSYGVRLAVPTDQGWQTFQRYIGMAAGLAGGLLMNIVYVAIFMLALLLMLIGSEDVVTKFQRRLGVSHDFVVRFTLYCTLIQKQYAIQTFSNFISAVSITVMLMAFRVDFALLWGLLAFVFGYVPNIGLILAITPAALLAFVMYGPMTAFVVVLIAALLSQIMDNVVTPRFMGKGLDLPVLFVFGSFIFWTWMFGAFGTLISLPLTLAIRTLVMSSPKASLVAELLTSTKSDKPVKRVKAA